MKEQYRLAHNLVDMAEDGAPLNEIADSLMRLRQLNEAEKDDAGMLLAIVVPVQVTVDQVVGRYPLVMIRKESDPYNADERWNTPGLFAERHPNFVEAGHEEVAVSFIEEQRLRKMGYVTQEELRDAEKSK